MENHFYHIRLPPLNVTIFITHIRRLRNGSYANVRRKDARLIWVKLVWFGTSLSVLIFSRLSN